MKILETILHWAFAVFVAIVSYSVSMVLMALLILKLMGLEIGVPPPPDFQPRIDPAVLRIAAACALYLPIMTASFLGAVTARNAQRRGAAVVLPVSVWAGVNAMLYFGRPDGGFDIRLLLESAACCAFVGIVSYIGWRRRRPPAARAA